MQFSCSGESVPFAAAFWSVCCSDMIAILFSIYSVACWSVKNIEIFHWNGFSLRTFHSLSLHLQSRWLFTFHSNGNWSGRNHRARASLNQIRKRIINVKGIAFPAQVENKCSVYLRYDSRFRCQPFSIARRHLRHVGLAVTIKLCKTKRCSFHIIKCY